MRDKKLKCTPRKTEGPTKVAELSVSPHDRRRIAVEAFCTEKAVENVLLGRSKPLVVSRVKKAAEALGIFLPEGL